MLSTFVKKNEFYAKKSSPDNEFLNQQRWTIEQSVPKCYVYEISLSTSNEYFLRWTMF